MNFTYFKGDFKTYIDHCILTKQAHNLVDSCKILSDNADNVSDHLPISISLNIPCEADEVSHTSLSSKVNKGFYGKNVKFRQAYKQTVTLLSKDIVIPHSTDDFISVNEAQIFFDKYCDTICDVMHQAADSTVKSEVNPKQPNKRSKHWWNNDCRIARDRHDSGSHYGVHV